MGAALAWRLLFLFLSPRAIDSADSIWYLENAQRFADGEFFQLSGRVPPLYPALTAIVALFIGDLEWAAIVVSLLASVLLIAPVFALTLATHGRPAARVAALTVCLWPWLVDYGCRVAPEALMSLLWFASAGMLVLAVRKGGLWCALAPLPFFGMHLTRPEGTFLWLASPFLALPLFYSDFRRGVRRLVPYVIISATLLALYAVYMRYATGEASLSQRANAATIHDVFFARGLDAAKTALRLFGDVLPIMLGPFLLVFAGVGLFSARDPARRDLALEAVLLAFAAAQFILAALSTFAEPRYIMNTAVALSLWSAAGIAYVAQLPHARWLRRVPVAALVALMLLGFAADVIPPLLGRMSYQPVEYKLAGRWMKENLEPGLILCRKPQVGFYAGMQTTGPDPGDTLDGILERAKQTGARYLVVDERYSTQMIPALKPLLDPSNAPRELRLLQSDLSPFPQARIVIYEIAEP